MRQLTTLNAGFYRQTRVGLRSWVLVVELAAPLTSGHSGCQFQSIALQSPQNVRIEVVFLVGWSFLSKAMAGVYSL